MRFLLSSALIVALGFLGLASADLRLASQPRNGFAVRDRGGDVKNFVPNVALYLEPSAFGYQGLANQRENNYDNFLRSNIDNEQDNRNFNTEPGRDHLPFRTFEAAFNDAPGTGAANDGKRTVIPASTQLTVQTGQEYVLPLRWNNPHASEMEVNIWIKNKAATAGAANSAYVVPIKLPVCSGEGYQDAVIAFTVPAAFNLLKLDGFTGCNVPGDCTLQVYAHSVEPRTYAIGVPIIVTGYDPAKATNAATVQNAQVEVGTDIAKLPRSLCRSQADKNADIGTNSGTQLAVFEPRWVSDVFNHAYQNSDYSPYSGQQPLAISRNLQAACVLRMTNANRGELGKAGLSREDTALLAKLRSNANQIVKNLEGATNKIINNVLAKAYTANYVKFGSAALAAQQETNQCFRCDQVSALSKNRLETNTYVPSFKIPAALVAAASNTLEAKYKGLIDQASGELRIYETALREMSTAYTAAAAKGLTYLPAALKNTATTMVDPAGVNFQKIDRNKPRTPTPTLDGGVSAANFITTYRTANAATLYGGNVKVKDLPVAAQEVTFGVDLASADLPASADGETVPSNIDDTIVDLMAAGNYKDSEDAVEGLPIRAGSTISGAEHTAAASAVVVAGAAVLAFVRF